MEGFPVLTAEREKRHDSFPASAHGVLVGLEDRSFWFAARNRVILYALERFFPEAEDFLEAGCGTGFVLRAVAQSRPWARIAGSDIFIEALRLSKGRVPEAEFFLMDILQVPFENEFSLIGIFDVLEHIDDDNRALANLRRALRPGGGLLITVPHHPELWSPSDIYARHKRRYSYRLLEEKLRVAGFRPLWQSAFISLLLPVMAAARFVERFSLSEASGSSCRTQLTLPRRIDRIFSGICDIEFALIRRGASLPLGGSLICVAEKVENP